MDTSKDNPEWFERQIKCGKSMVYMAKELGCGKDVIRRRLQKYGLYKFYNETHEFVSKNVLFRINNPELKKQLETYGPLYNVID